MQKSFSWKLLVRELHVIPQSFVCHLVPFQSKPDWKVLQKKKTEKKQRQQDLDAVKHVSGAKCSQILLTVAFHVVPEGFKEA